jgi:hypothetical protein
MIQYRSLCCKRCTPLTRCVGRRANLATHQMLKHPTACCSADRPVPGTWGRGRVRHRQMVCTRAATRAAPIDHQRRVSAGCESRRGCGRPCQGYLSNSCFRGCRDLNGTAAAVAVSSGIRDRLHKTLPQEERSTGSSRHGHSLVARCPCRSPTRPPSTPVGTVGRSKYPPPSSEAQSSPPLCRRPEH